MSASLEYWSSIEHAAFMHALVREMSGLGHESRLCYAVSAGDYRSAQSGWGKLRLRWRCYIGYPWRIWRACSRPGTRVAIITSNTFYVPGLIARSHHPDVVPVHLMYDLYPDALIHAGIIRENGWADRLLGRWMRRSFVDAAANVFLGEHLLRYAEARHGKIPRAVVIPVGAEGAFFNDHFPMSRPDGVAPVIYYGGNLGRMHDVATFAGVLSAAEASHFVWKFQGNGGGMLRLAELKATGRLPEWVDVGGNLPDSAWAAAMLAADIALVTILPGAEAVVMPSKTYSALVAGQAILAIAPRASDLADLVLKHDCGWVIEPEALAVGRPDQGIAGLKSLLAHLAAHPEEILLKRQNAYQAGHAHYDMAVVAKQWDALLRNIGTNRS